MKGKSGSDFWIYEHDLAGLEVQAIGGDYTLFEEGRLKAEFGDVLYVMGSARFDATCCGAGGCCYALVLGVVQDDQAENGSGIRSGTRLRFVKETFEKSIIEKSLIKKLMVQQVVFKSGF